MPTITSNLVSGSGELTTASATFVDALCTSPALADGVDYVVIGLANHRNNGAGYASELEYRFGTTRLGLDRFRAPFGNFNLGDDAAGNAPLCVAQVTGDGSSALNMRARGEDNGTDDVIVGAQTWAYFDVDGFTAGEDLVVAQVLADTETARPTSSAWIEGSAGGQARVTPTVSGTWLIMATIESAADGDAAGTNEFRARLRMVADPDGTPAPTTIGSGEQYHAISATDPDHYAPIFGEMDVVTLTSGVTYDFLWEVANADANDDIGYRRERVIAVRLDRFRSHASIVNGGGMVSTGAEAPATNGLTFDFSSTGGDVIVLGSAGYINDGTWGDVWLRREGTPDVESPGGFGAGRFSSLVATTYAGDIITIQQAHRIESAAGSETYRLVAQADGPSGLGYGRTRGNAGDGRALVVALEMFAVDDVSQLAGEVTSDIEWTVTTSAVEGLFSDGVTGDVQWTVTTDLVFALEGEATGDVQWSASTEQVFGLEGEVTADVEWSVTTIVGGVSQLEGEVTADVQWTVTTIVIPDMDDVIGGAGDELELGVAGLDQYGVLRYRPGDTRPMRFELLDIAGAGISHDLIDSITVQVRRASNPPGAVNLSPTEDEETIDDVTYGWAVDLSGTITVSGVWVLEVDVELVDGTTATWPSRNPLRIGALEGVG